MRAYFFSFTLLASLVLLSSSPLRAQEPAQPSAPPSTPSTESTSKNPGQASGRHSNDFLVRGTVFTEDGLVLPGAELRIRRSSEKKFRWDTETNSRGNFAVRVKMGADYEVVVRAKGYQDQSLAVNAKTGDRYKDLVFRMQHQGGKKIMTTRLRLVAATLILLFVAGAAFAQGSKHDSQLKTVRGVVTDKSDNPIPSGVVFLKNVRSNQVRSYIADNEGNFRFSGLDPNADYELHAEKDGAKSQTRNVSSFDSRLDIVLNLKLEKKKS